jgi:RNA polymerase sigma-70 factor (ECF subfamily)
MLTPRVARPTDEVRVRAHADALFVALYRAHFTYVWHTLRRLGLREADLADGVHDVFVVVHRKLPGYDDTRPPKPWLFGIAYRTALDKKRKAHVAREVFTEVSAPSSLPSSIDALEAKEAHALVLRGLDALDLEKRAVFVLHEIEGHTMPEIQRVLDVPLNTLYSRLRLARESFAKAVRG